MANAMLTIENVSAHYGKIQALHNVSLYINQGEIVTLIGANGAGKPRCWVRYAANRARRRAPLPLMAKPLPTGKPHALCVKRSPSCRKADGSFRA